MKKAILLTLCLLLAAPLLAGTRSIDESRKADPDAEVSIELIAGKIHVVAWDRDEVRVSGTINDEWEEFEMEGEGDDISIEISPPEGKHRNIELEADLEISVPAGVELSFETVSSPIRVDGLRGSVSIETVSGNVDIKSDLEELEIEAISSSVDIEATSRLRSASVEIVSGSVEMDGDLHPSGDYSFSAVSGTITLRVPSNAAADYEIETFSGNIDNDFGPKPEKAEFLPSKSLSFSVGSGGADVVIETLNGTIRLESN
ncbi:MAG: DUF4097 family beta strand repeat protein [Acidobacteria bacterium]|nr:DUF4097 family beta strand repeat protein [Acidobacteriota bacterium]NIM61704.1 DUF4097 family beta strand repeat protein [Acidobacteriota bacterium]NIO58186.1 DUF4097 family beta strand repeat protein [Acidobacteriota bacterium]NIQ83751.1 DUF4097 family beta strand repeat protein [Acidobacteriota bacterium]NIT09914.1 DUF4097 family beta strand repeat protein [Acidobacteriota bacterium]